MDSQDSRLDVPLAQVAVHLHPQDNVAIAKVELAAGIRLLLAGSADAPRPLRLQVQQTIPAGHKVALQPIAAGEPVLRYGQEIGLAGCAIRPGEHVHTHNLAVAELEPGRSRTSQAHDAGVADAAIVRPPSLPVDGVRQTFMGYKRPDGRVGTRNYIAVISTVNCSAHVTRSIAAHFTSERLAGFSHVDGVAAFTHHFGCTYRVGSRDELLLQRTLAGFARHPNVGAYLLVGLGCETNQIDDLAGHCGLRVPDGRGLVIQELGGILKTVEAGIAAVESLLPEVDRARRTPQPLSDLVIALQCGGSDAWSGVTANPAVGLVSDELVRRGGTVVLAETPEIYGAEHLLVRRAAGPEVSEKLLAQVRWWEEHARRLEMDLDDNRSVGNAAGGLTTIYEKSLGAVAKAGSTPLVEVYGYAEPVAAHGFVFMNSPGYDPVSVTGQVAGGCNLVLFTTGRGSVLGFKPAPVVKIASSSAIYECMVDDMDLNAGSVLEGATLEEIAAELFKTTVAVASGRPSKSEAQGVGEAEFSPWFLGGML
jgi:altronate dehydratase